MSNKKSVLKRDETKKSFYRDKKWLEEKYLVEELPSTDIAKLCNVAKKTILLWMKKFEIKPRTQKESKQTKNYLNKISGENHPNYTKIGGYVTAKRRGYGNLYSCCICGWDEATNDIHHIIPRNQGGSDTFDNLTILCPNCHRKSHRNLIEINEILNLNEIINGTVVGTQS